MRIEIRGNQVLLDGYVNAVGRDSRVLPSPKGKFIEQIVPKTFQRALDKAENVDLLFNHSRERKLGSTKEGNLQLYEDNIGLRAICTVSDDEIIEKARNGELRGWSFGFYTIKDRWEDTENGLQRRYLEDIELCEVSILDKTPAYIATTIEARGEDDLITEQRNAYFKAVIEDNSPKNESKEPEKREEKPVDYSLFEKEIEILKMKGGK